MNNRFKEIFGQIQAEEELKNHTRVFLEQKTQGYTGVKAEKRYPLYAAVCACLLFVLFGGYWLYFTPTAKISIDINPSIELSVNRFDQVISVNDFNEDGQEFSSALNVKYRTYTDAIEQILKNDIIVELLSHDEVMTITVAGPDGLQSEKILSGIKACTAEQNNTYCYSASSEEFAAAHEMGLSCGKYRAFLELQALDPNITPQTVQGMTMREIRDLVDSLSAGGEKDSSSYSGRGNRHHRHGGGHGRGWENGE